jgi:hypothetical protein
MPDRLKRLDVVYQRSPIYFVTACAANRRALLANQEIHSALRAFADCAPNCGAWVGLLRSSDSYSQKWAYVRENPVRAGLATAWEEWPFLGEIFALEFHDPRF